jgi:hypothetical protein
MATRSTGRRRPSRTKGPKSGILKSSPSSVASIGGGIAPESGLSAKKRLSLKVQIIFE